MWKSWVVAMLVAGCAHVSSPMMQVRSQAAADHGCTLDEVAVREQLPSGRYVVSACDGSFYTYTILRSGSVHQVEGAMPPVARGCATIDGDAAEACRGAAASYSCSGAAPFSQRDEIDRGTMWLTVCGTLRLFTRVDGAWREDHHAARPDDTTSPPSGSDYAASSGSSGGDVYVRGYYRRDGTYVHPHTRSRPR